MNQQDEYIVELVRLALDRDTQSVRQLARKILRNTPDGEKSEFRQELASLLVGKSDSTDSVMRSTQVSSRNGRTAKDLVRAPTLEKDCPPILQPDEASVLQSVISEHRSRGDLVDAGVEPTRSLLLTGPPGVGKTHAASYLADRLEVPLLTVDLSYTISSYLGQTGENLRAVLDHARHNPCLLFLDEFDALAKRRDDDSDAGEIRRIVNVLLLELDDWFTQGLLVAATNHEELLDSAIWRRFDRVLEISRPTTSQRKAILEHYLSNKDINGDQLTDALAAISDGATGSEIESIVQNAVRTSVIDENISLEESLIDETVTRCLTDRNGRKSKVHFAEVASERLGMSHRAIGRMLNVSHVTVGRWLRAERD